MNDVTYCLHCGARDPRPGSYGVSHGAGICTMRCYWCSQEVQRGMTCTCRKAIELQPAQKSDERERQ